MSALIELTELALTRPTLHDPAGVVADWYERKAALLHQIAAAGGPDVATYETFAQAAHEHAARLLDPYTP